MQLAVGARQSATGENLQKSSVLLPIWAVAGRGSIGCDGVLAIDYCRPIAYCLSPIYRIPSFFFFFNFLLWFVSAAVVKMGLVWFGLAPLSVYPGLMSI